MGLGIGIAGLAISAGSAIFKGVSSYAEGQAQGEAADQQAYLAKIQGEIGGIQADVNATLIGDQIRDVKQVAAMAVRARQGMTERQKGAQTASVAAQGVDLGGGTLAPALAETAVIGAQDVTAIQNNAAREVFGLRTARENQKFAAEMSRTMGLATAQQLSAAGDAARTRGAIGFGASMADFGMSVGGSLLQRSMRQGFSKPKTEPWTPADIWEDEFKSKFYG